MHGENIMTLWQVEHILYQLHVAIRLYERLFAGAIIISSPYNIVWDGGKKRPCTFWMLR